MPAQHGPLAVLEILSGALSFPWKYRGVLPVMWAPLLAVIAVAITWDFTQPEEHGAASWGLYLLDAIATSWLAITVHRLVLVVTPVAPGVEGASLRRLGLFVGVLAAGWLLFAGLSRLLEVMAMDSASEIYVEADASPLLVFALVGVGLLMLLLVLWVFSRLSLLFPAIAIDRGFDHVAAWRLSRGNSLRLMFIVGVFPFLLAMPILLVYREDATVLESIAIEMLTVLLLVVEVAALSLAYEQLTAHAPPPTDPPA